MKTKISNYMLAIMAIILLGAFQVKQPASLTGVWKLKSFIPEYAVTMTGKARSAAEADMKELAGRLKKTTFIFSADGNLSYLGHQGKWSMSNDGKTVRFISNTNEKSTVTIIKLSEQDLLFKRVDDGITQTFHLFKVIREIR
jgi:hypothetical protein